MTFELRCEVCNLLSVFILGFSLGTATMWTVLYLRLHHIARRQSANRVR